MDMDSGHNGTQGTLKRFREQEEVLQNKKLINLVAAAMLMGAIIGAEGAGV